MKLFPIAVISVGTLTLAAAAVHAATPEEIAKALGAKQAEAERDGVYRVSEPGRGLIGFAAVAPASWGNESAEVAVLVSTNGRIMKAAALAPIPKEQSAVLAGLRKKTPQETASLAEIHSAGSASRAVLDAAREAMAKIYRFWGVSDFAALESLRKADRMPLAPDTRYETLKGVMTVVMANYRSAWSQLKAGHFGLVGAAAEHMAALIAQAPAHGPQVNKHRKTDFDAEVGKMRSAAIRLARSLREKPDRAQASKDLLDIYHACQSCHDVFAPEETADKRKYAPEM